MNTRIITAALLAVGLAFGPSVAVANHNDGGVVSTRRTAAVTLDNVADAAPTWRLVLHLTNNNRLTVAGIRVQIDDLERATVRGGRTPGALELYHATGSGRPLTLVSVNPAAVAWYEVRPAL